MEIKIKDGDVNPHDIVGAIEQHFARSRFTLDTEIRWRRSARGRNVIKLSMVRLREAKPYCGNHPDACEVGQVGTPRKARFLEGVDWVDFNDQLNDVLDRLDLDADVASSVCNIRQGTLRRIAYTSQYAGFNGQTAWVKVGASYDYANFCGSTEAPDSDYPHGTPGEYTRGLEVTA